MTKLQVQVTINNLKEMVIAAEMVLEKLEKAQKDLETPPPHKWKHGDVFENRWGVTMICIMQFGRTQVFCMPGPCSSTHDPDEILREGKFLFNIKEKL